jgi:hypothetical protein
MTITGKDAEAVMEEMRARNAEVEREAMTRRKAEATRNGKEPFDLGRLEALVDTSREGRVDPVETRTKRFEQMYYLQFPDVLTIAEFAKKVAELNEWS